MAQGDATRARSQRPDSAAGAARKRTRASGQREAMRSALTPGSPGDAVLSWCPSPRDAKARARSALGGVPRNSESATTSAAQRAI